MNPSQRERTINILQMVIADWAFIREQTGLEQPDSPELTKIKELLEEMESENV